MQLPEIPQELIDEYYDAEIAVLEVKRRIQKTRCNQPVAATDNDDTVSPKEYEVLYPEVQERTVQAAAKAGRIPGAHKRRNRWRVPRSVTPDDWI